MVEKKKNDGKYLPATTRYLGKFMPVISLPVNQTVHLEVSRLPDKDSSHYIFQKIDGTYERLEVYETYLEYETYNKKGESNKDCLLFQQDFIIAVSGEQWWYYNLDEYGYLELAHKLKRQHLLKVKEV